MKKQSLRSLLASAVLAVPLVAFAEDIDLFVNSGSAASEAPNMLLVVDTGAGFSKSTTGQFCRITATGEVFTDNGTDATELSGTSGGIEQCALYSVIKSLDATSGTNVKVNIGVMLFNSNSMLAVNPDTLKLEAVCPGSNGGCLAYPIVPFTAVNKANLLAWIRNWKTNQSSSVGDDVKTVGHNIKGPASLANGAAMQEAWAYYTGRMGLSGRNYTDTRPPSMCGKDFVVFIGNAFANNASPKDSTGNAGPMGALGGSNTTNTLINASPAATAAQQVAMSGTIPVQCTPGSSVVNEPLQTSEGKGVYALNWALYLNQQHKITTYSVGILGQGCNTEYAAHLSKLGQASVGNGKYFATNSFDELRDALNLIFGEIQSVSSVFAAVSLPVSVNTQGTFLNQVYIGMFRPDSSRTPHWAGNLKQYKLGILNSELRLQDADGESAVNSSTGFITECARSFWTPTTADGYWSGGNDYQKGTCATFGVGSNYPDGDVVEKGAQAYTLRGITPAARNVKTCSSVFATCASTATLTNFSTSNTAITWDKLGLASATDTPSATNLVDWARGKNVKDELAKGVTVMRPSVHGDVVHSRPVAVNYGTDVTPQVVVYYGTNDGMLRAVNGNRDLNLDGSPGSTTYGGTTYAPGMELWSFMPPEFYRNIQRLYRDAPTIALKVGSASDALPKPYGFDGPLTVYRSGSAAWLYTTMRRGGRVIYAFDVSAPNNPTLKWKKGCPNNFSPTGTVSDVDCSADFAGIGQTWSSAKTLYATGHGSGQSPMLIMGGGYDTCEDADNNTNANHACTTTTKGNVIYVLDADTGARLRALPTDRSVVSDITIVKDGGSNVAKFAYATDLGGNVYRISGADAHTAFESTAPSAWTITKIASLGCDSVDLVNPCTANRKFMYAPDVVYDNGLYILSIGSGDREKPLLAYGGAARVANHFFVIKDNPSDTAWLADERANCNSTPVICKNSLYGISGSDNTTPAQSELDAKKGWYLTLASQEQVVTSSVTVFGTVTFSTHKPAVPNGSCGSNLGTAQVYNLAYTNAASLNGTDSRFQSISGGGLPPSPVAGMVTLDNGQTVPFCIGCSANSPLDGTLKIKPSSGSSTAYKSRLYWYIQK
jgi:type IV pilus assembly protein PilY1